MLAVGVAVTALAAVGGGAYAASSATAISRVPVTGIDHQRLTFTLAPGASQVFKLPAANDPVRRMTPQSDRYLVRYFVGTLSL